MNYKNFGLCLLYDEMSEGETYYTAQQMSDIAELISDSLAVKQPGIAALRRIRRQCAEIRWDADCDMPDSCLVHGILLTAARFIGQEWDPSIPHDWEIMTEIANAHMAGV